jgi:peptidyl-prolyl cis-trans isomerase C
LLVLTFSTSAPSAGLSGEETKRRSVPVAHVGQRIITVGELEDQLAHVPAFQLVSFGATPAEARQTFLQEVVIRDALLSAGAEKRKVDADPLVRMQLARARATLSLRAAEGTVGAIEGITKEDIAHYYDAHRSDYEKDARILVWHIVVKTREEAQKILDAVKKDGTTKEFTRIARDESLDKVTNLRSGNLGFIGPDGTSSEAGIKVDPNVVRAAQVVKDGEFASEPVAEGELFAVVWRRGSTPAQKRPLEDASAEIRETVHKQRLEAARKKLIEDLRTKSLRDVDVSALKAFEVDLGEGAIFVDKKPK